MSGVAIYMEGGGDTANTRRRLRRGMDGFLRELKAKCRESRWNWRMTPSGGRDETLRDFDNARRRARPGEVVVLLVDSEAPISAASPAAHLRTEARQARRLKGAPDDAVHLMVQTMETWIAADREALESYYGRGFDGNALPKAADLETIGKDDVAGALARATRRTGKGSYKKIEHASGLLARIDPAKARRRCRHCDRLFSVLTHAI